MSADVAILGIGRPHHGDDALGPAAAELLAARLAGTARVIPGGTGWGALCAAGGERLLVILDAAEAGECLRPGDWRRLIYPRDEAGLDASGLRDTHTARAAQALALATALGGLPPNVWIYALAGERFLPETELSPSVGAALDAFVARVEADIREWLGLP